MNAGKQSGYDIVDLAIWVANFRRFKYIKTLSNDAEIVVRIAGPKEVVFADVRFDGVDVFIVDQIRVVAIVSVEITEADFCRALAVSVRPT